MRMTDKEDGMDKMELEEKENGIDDKKDDDLIGLDLSTNPTNDPAEIYFVYGVYGLSFRLKYYGQSMYIYFVFFFFIFLFLFIC